MKKMIKKVWLIAFGLLCAAAMFGGCSMLDPGVDAGGGGEDGPKEKTELEIIAEKYAKLGDVQTVGQTIEITQDGLVRYASEKTYKKAGTGYQITGTERKLNSLKSGSGDPYTETVTETTVQAGTFSARLDLNELYFSKSEIVDGTLEATVLDSSVETVLGLGEELPASVHNLTLKIVTDETYVTDIAIRYASGGSDVTITLKFSY